ncbi:MAG TPA: tRNA pseudouridine(55) synthase TruB [Steroidobacteraceae bacterium]|jgi:tRNA pseudouridine55 synthase|nr:tRNA pseudouridine(55) synthase TruB [Steroidobacteraceae bacterium]
MAIEAAPPCGILLLDKPSGLSSNAALQRVRHLLGRPKAGHTGSLDPLATGMLPICIGEATKVAGALLAGAKGYTVEMRLGERTDTGDAEGEIIERQAVLPLDATRIECALRALRGPQQQIPPMYSALKHKGQPLYKLARQGLSVERSARSIEIHLLELLDFTAVLLRLRVECSKGTYIRTLVEQLGVHLGSCAHVSALRRDFVEPFRGESMHTLEALQTATREPALLPADRAVAHLPALYLSETQARAMSFGQQIAATGTASGQLRLYDPSGRFLGLGMGAEGGSVRPLRLFSCGATGLRN